MSSSKYVNQVALGRQQSAVSLNPLDFDNAIATQGVKLVHWRSMRCPVGMTDLYDGRRADGHDHDNCNNGFIYTEVGEVATLFTGNSENLQLTDIGTIDGSTVQTTFQRHYEGTKDDVHIAVFDRFYLTDPKILVPQWQTFEAHITGRDRLQFPAVVVQDLMDSDGRVYVQDRDFDIVDGFIVWTGSNRPRYDAGAQKGQICSIRYLYRPFYICSRILHQTRVAQVAGALVRMPQAAILTRESVFQNANREEGSEDERQAPAPADGTWGPR
jgi:hypothetical protein